MFKNINIKFEKKVIFFRKKEEKSQLIKECLSLFLKNRFRNNLDSYYSLSYDPRKEDLEIVTANKILANELVLELANLADFFKSNKIELRRILIR